MSTQYWLVKTEPDAFSWQRQVKDGVSRWDGVRNHQAAQNLRKMKKDDLVFFYHSNIGKEIVGIVRVAREAYPDPTDKTGKFVCVEMQAVEALPTPVTLKAIKAESRFADMMLVRHSRISVSPVTPEAWALIRRMGGLAK